MLYKLKIAAKRGSALLGAIGLLAGVGTSAIPAFTPVASADSLNPLTKRSLTLSSSSPGWSYTDGSGNPTYAPPNSGANGKQTGNTFAFHNSTPTGHIKTMSFQYCTNPAGDCISPGNDDEVAGTGTITLTPGSPAVTGSTTGTATTFTTQLPTGTTFTTAGGYSYTVASVADDSDLTLTANAKAGDNESGVAFTYRGTDDVSGQKSDLNVVSSSPAEVQGSDFGTVVGNTDASVGQNPNGDVSAVPGVTDPLTSTGHPITTGQYAAHAVAGNFLVMYVNSSGDWQQSTGWTMSVANVENSTTSPLVPLTGKNNYIVLTNNSSDLNVPFDTPIKVVFFATASNYITNPGKGAFFVKINTYSNTYDGSTAGHNLASLEPASDGTVIDGGVTVANVMNQSIQITTKVLETMQFSVGTVDPDTLSDLNGDSTHQSDYEKAIGQAADGNATTYIPCQAISTALDPANDQQNVLELGNQSAESSLSDEHTYITHSYWRLSSNSSAGATVYYSGHTLSNTEGDQISPIGATAAAPSVGGEQFGLALDNGTSAPYDVDYGQENGSGSGSPWENAADNGKTLLTDAVLGSGGTNPNASYHTPRLAPLVPAANYANGSGTINGGSGTSFAFDSSSDTIPTPLASESDQVVNCVTGKMRYIANIAAITPAGIYTTKVNYIAAPQY